MEVWCPDDMGRDSWDWVGPPAWGRACFNSAEWGGGSSPVKNGASPDCIIVVVIVVERLPIIDQCTLLWIIGGATRCSPLYHVRGSVSERTTSCTCRTLPEQNSSIRCWTAANACSAELIRHLACTVSLSRLTHLASNSSVTVKIYCRGSTLNHQ